MDILDEIVAHKRIEIAAMKEQLSEREIIQGLRTRTSTAKSSLCYVVLPLKTKAYNVCWMP